MEKIKQYLDPPKFFGEKNSVLKEEPVIWCDCFSPPDLIFASLLAVSVVFLVAWPPQAASAPAPHDAPQPAAGARPPESDGSRRRRSKYQLF